MAGQRKRNNIQHTERIKKPQPIDSSDFSKLKKAEEALKASELKFRTVADYTYDWEYWTGPDGCFEYISPSCERVTGYRQEEFVNHPDLLIEIIHPQDQPLVLKHIKEKHENAASIDYRIITRSGEIRWIAHQCQPIFTQEGTWLGQRVSNRDITDRKQAEEALVKAKEELESRIQERTSELSHSEDKFRRIFETANEAIWVVDLKGKIILANNRACEMLGYPLEEIIGRYTQDFLIKKQERMIPIKIRKALEKGGKLTYERRLRHKNGSTIYLLVNSSPLLDSEGRHIANIGMMANITRRKKAEDALALAKAELEKANQQLKAYGHRITQVQEEERKRIAYELHDDTAQYISILKMQIGSLVQSGKIRRADVLEKLKFLEKDADRAFHDVRRYSHELRPVVLEHMGLLAALEQIAEDINKLNYFKVEVDASGREPYLSEEVKLGFFRIAQEALNNIRKHSKADKAIISLKFQKKHLSMMVIDNGIGFDIKQSNATTGSKGNLGLMSMRERADLIGANLKIESKPGQGTIISVEIPL